MRFQPASDRSLLVTLGDGIELETHHRITKLLRSLEGSPIPGVRNLHPAYASVLITFDLCSTTHAELEADLAGRLERLDALSLPDVKRVEIPVSYGGEFGPDLAEVARHCAVTEEEVIRLHSRAVYHVYFLGFVPGFAYLGGLPAPLATPRLAVPRKLVEPGSVGIAGNQTGVYPRATPGGWQLIGRTPLTMFRGDRNPPSLLAVGDQVRFVAISTEQYHRMECA